MNYLDEREAFGEIPDHFDQVILDAFHMKEKPMMRRRITATIVIAALMVVLLAATALAYGFRRSIEADAVARARQALITDYQLSVESLGCFTYEAKQENGDWVVTFTGAAWAPERLGTYVVHLQPTGAPRTSWTHDGIDPALLEDGDLNAAAWGQAQIMRKLAMDAAQGDAGAAVQADSLKKDTPAMAQRDEPGAAVRSAAKHALTAAFEVGDEVLDLFDVVPVPVPGSTGDQWEIWYYPKTTQRIQDLAVWNDIAEKIGNYAVIYDCDTEEVLDVSWSHETEWVDQPYAQDTWATAPAYHGRLLPWVKALRDATNAIAARYPEDASDYDYTWEDAAAYDTYFRQAGFDAQQFSRSMPGKDDIAYEEARAIAMAAILSEMPHAQDALAHADIRAEYSLFDPDTPMWRFSCFFQNDGIEINFGVAMDAKTGEVLLINPVVGGDG